MVHEWFDDDVDDCIVYNVGPNANGAQTPFVEIEGDCSTHHYSLLDLQYMSNRLGGKLNEVSPNEVTTKLTREDIIMLAKTAGITAEELV